MNHGSILFSGHNHHEIEQEEGETIGIACVCASLDSVR